MVEELRAIFQILGDTTLQLGEYALWAGGGFILYKMATLASYLVLAKYAIGTFFNYLNNRQIKVKEKGQNILTGDMVIYKSKNLIVSKTYKKPDGELMLLVDEDRWTGQDYIARHCSVVRAIECELIG